MCFNVIDFYLLGYVFRASRRGSVRAYVCVRVYVCTYVHIYIYIYIYIYIHTYIHTYIYIYIYTHIHTYIYIYTRTDTYMNCMHVRIMYIHSCMYIVCTYVRSISEISSCFFGPRPWHIEIRHRVKRSSTINLLGSETLKLKIRRLKLWKPTVASWVKFIHSNM